MEFTASVAVMWPDITGIDNHAKCFIVDEKYFSLGGTNLDVAACTEGTWTPPRNYNKSPLISQIWPSGMRDQDLVGKGELASQLRHHFHKFYALWENYNRTGVFEKDPEKFANNNHYFQVTQRAAVAKFDQSEKRRFLNRDKVKILIGGPHQQLSLITQEYVRLIDAAQKEIIIANLYFCPVDSIFQALLRAVNRGVKITVITNGVSDMAPDYTQYFCWANRIHYVPLFYGRTFLLWDQWNMGGLPVKDTRIFEYHVKDILLHKKMMIVDGRTLVVGSYNFGSRSDNGDYELVLVAESEELAEDLKKVHEKDLSHSRQVFPAEACSWYFDPFKVSLGELQKRFHGLL